MEGQKLTGYPGNKNLKEMLQETSLTAKGCVWPGVTLLDYFAAKAMQSILVNNMTELGISEMAYSIAEAMIKEREKHLK